MLKGKKLDKQRIAYYLLNIARYTLLILALLVFVFALFSGAQRESEFAGIIENSPNVLPWLLILLLVFIAWKWELVGGIIITLFGFFMIYFFNFSGPNFFLVTFFLTLLITTLGSLFIVSWLITNKKSVN